MKKLSLMTEAGKRIGIIKFQIIPKIIAGATPLEIDALVDRLIVEQGDYPSFKTVSGYRFATCININSGMVHGIPTDTPFLPSDVVTVDLGLLHHGFHVDTAFTVQISPHHPEVQHFLSIGEKALASAISQAKIGNSVYDISSAMEKVITVGGYSPITELTGHGIGRQLHLPPAIYCYAHQSSKKVKLHAQQALAIEAMYAMGKPKLVQSSDGWTLSTVDGSLTGMFEETIFVTPSGPLILTQTRPS
jgi:methionyl aminopeptidase